MQYREKNGKVSIALIMLLLISIAGCAAPPEQLRPVRFFHSTATEEQFIKDRNECFKVAVWIKAKGTMSGFENYSSANQKSLKRVIPSCRVFSFCLSERGYLETEDGNLEVARNEIIICTPK
jgi:uncharacterized protein YPO0396